MKSGDELREILESFAMKFEWRYVAAYQLRINPQQLSGMISGKLPITERIAKQLGYTTVRMYKEI